MHLHISVLSWVSQSSDVLRHVQPCLSLSTDYGHLIRVFFSNYLEKFWLIGEMGWINCGLFGVLSQVITAIFFCYCEQVLNRPCVTIITNAGSSIVLVHKKSQNWIKLKKKHKFIFVLIIRRAAFVVIVTHGQTKTWLWVSSSWAIFCTIK